MKLKPLLALLICACISMISTTVLSANEQPIMKRGEIFLIDTDGNETRIGEVSFSQSTGASKGFDLEVDGPAFSDHFLSMRPFRCITGASEWYCALPYPYALRKTVSAQDLTDLEYSLLFIRKKPQEFGIDAWNGLYYDLAIQADGSITGELLEGDLNVLASPPEEDFSRPIDLSEFTAASKARRFKTIIIRPQ